MVELEDFECVESVRGNDQDDYKVTFVEDVDYLFSELIETFRRNGYLLQSCGPKSSILHDYDGNQLYATFSVIHNAELFRTEDFWIDFDGNMPEDE